MNEIIQEGKTREEAVALALEKLGVAEDEVEVEDLEAPRDRFFGLLTSKNIRLKVKIKDVQTPEATPEATGDEGPPEMVVQEFMRNVLEKMGVRLNASVEREGTDIFVNLDGEDAGMIIGKFGQTLDSLQYLSNVVVGKNFKENFKVSVNVGDYRSRREESLRRMAKSMAGKVVKTHKGITLAPMTPQDRRIIHVALANYRDVSTASEGAGPNRRVVITFKK